MEKSKRVITAVIGMALTVTGCVLVLMVGYLYSKSPMQGDGRFGYGKDARKTEISYEVVMTDIPVEAKEIRVWVPIPLNSHYQELTDFNVDGNNNYSLVQENRFGNRFILFDLSDAPVAGEEEISFTVKFMVTREFANALVVRSSVPTGFDSPLRYTGPYRLIPTKGAIAEEAQRVAGHISDDFWQARALYDHIVDTMKYDESGSEWGREDAVYARDIRTGNCTDFHSLFIGEARSLGIPARFIMGLPLDPESRAGEIDGYHCWAEFYIEGMGWLPVDASEANRNIAKREDFFGRVDQHRVAFTIGRDIKLPAAKKGPLNYSIFPYAEIDGEKYSNVNAVFSFKDQKEDSRE